MRHGLNFTLKDSGVNARLAECLNSVLNVKAVVAAFNQEKALVGAYSVITTLQIAFVSSTSLQLQRHCSYSPPAAAVLVCPGAAGGRAGVQPPGAGGGGEGRDCRGPGSGQHRLHHRQVDSRYVDNVDNRYVDNVDIIVYHRQGGHQRDPELH